VTVVLDAVAEKGTLSVVVVEVTTAPTLALTAVVVVFRRQRQLTLKKKRKKMWTIPVSYVPKRKTFR
jgi:hypothetical protein